MDASVFVYAYLKPKERAPPDVQELKMGAQEIVKRIGEGEGVLTSLIHLSEVSNILEARASLYQSIEVISALLARDNMEVVEPTKKAYLEAVERASSLAVGVNDALAYLIMQRRDIKEIYSFDKDFDKMPSINRITK